jgi:hypothetical protein
VAALEERGFRFVEVFDLGPPAFRVGNHGSEFEETEWLPVLADAGLEEDRISRGFDADGNHQNREQGKKENEGDQGDDQIEEAFRDLRHRFLESGQRQEGGLPLSNHLDHAFS